MVGSSLAVYSGFRFVRRAQETGAAGRGRQHRPHPRRRDRGRRRCRHLWEKSCRAWLPRWVYDREGDRASVMKLSLAGWSWFIALAAGACGSDSTSRVATRPPGSSGGGSAGSAGRRAAPARRARRHAGGGGGRGRGGTTGSAGTTGGAGTAARSRSAPHARAPSNCSQADGPAICCLQLSTCMVASECPASPTYVPCSNANPCSKGGWVCCTAGGMSFCTKQSGCPAP